MSRNCLILGAVFAFLSVALGAFGAHALKSSLDAPSLAVYQTGVQYQAFHSLALLAVGILISLRAESKQLRFAGWLFPLGILIFSGSLYALAITGVKWLGAITPFGGICFLTGWACLIWEAAASPRADSRSS